MFSQVEGTVAQNGICLGDISGDGNHELIVGNEAGELFIFKVFKNKKKYFRFEILRLPSCLQNFIIFHWKGSRVIPWLRCTDLGFITAIGVGDLLGLGHR